MIDLWDMAKSANFTEKELESFRVSKVPGDAGSRFPVAPFKLWAGVARLFPAPGLTQARAFAGFFSLLSPRPSPCWLAAMRDLRVHVCTALASSEWRVRLSFGCAGSEDRGLVRKRTGHEGREENGRPCLWPWQWAQGERPLGSLSVASAGHAVTKPPQASGSGIRRAQARGRRSLGQEPGGVGLRVGPVG